MDFIENYIKLNSKEQKQFEALVKSDDEYGEVIRMITVYEERGQVKEAQKAVLQVLDARFGNIAYPVKEKISYCEDLDKLEKALRLAATIQALDKFDI